MKVYLKKAKEVTFASLKRVSVLSAAGCRQLSRDTVLGADVQVLAGGSCRSGLCEERLGCLLLDTGDSSWVQPTHCRAWLSSAHHQRWCHLSGDVYLKEQNAAQAEEEGGKSE